MENKKNKEKNFISTVVYVHNNEKDIKLFLSNINNKLSENFDKYEIVCVNDFSNDESIKKIKEAANDISCIVSIINMSNYQGLENSMKAGIDLSIGDYVYEFDEVNNNLNFDLLIDSYYTTLDGYDIVAVGPKKSCKLTSKLFYKIFNKYSNINYDIGTELFRILSRRAINRVRDLYDFVPYRKAAYANCGLKRKMLYYDKKIRYSSIKNKHEKNELGLTSLILFTNVFYKMSLIMAVLMVFVSLFSLIYAVIVFVGGNPVAGWTTTMLLISIGFLGIFLLTAMIIKYLSVLIRLSFRKRDYLIESIEKVTK